MEFPNKDTILETTSESLKSISVLTHQPSHFANFKKHSSLLNRTGHARFRRAPVVPLPQRPQTLFPSTTMTPRPLHIQPQHQFFTKPSILKCNPKFLSLDLEFPKEMYNVSSNSSFVSSAITGDGSVSNRYTNIRTVRVAVIGDDIPNDGYSWRKYGKKFIVGTPYPRGYYKCTIMKKCPARRMVERAKDDPKMMILTYKEQHCHERVNHRLKLK